MAWTLDRIRYTDEVPDKITTCRLVREYHSLWVHPQVDGNPVDAFNLTTFLQERANISFQPVNWLDFELFFNGEQILLHRLRSYTATHDMDEGTEISQQLMECARVLFNMHDYVLHAGRFLALLNPYNDMRESLCERLQNEEVFLNEVSSRYEHNSIQCTNLQNLLIFLIKILESSNLYRYNGRLYQRSMVNNKIQYNEKYTIKEFVSLHTSHAVNFRAWQWAMNPFTNLDRTVKYLTTCPLANVHDISESDIKLDIFLTSAITDESVSLPELTSVEFTEGQKRKLETEMSDYFVARKLKKLMKKEAERQEQMVQSLAYASRHKLVGPESNTVIDNFVAALSHPKSLLGKHDHFEFVKDNGDI